MKTPSAHRAILKRANELGYFPTPGQAKEISHASADEYGKRGGPSRVPEELYWQCTDWAIKFIMEGRMKKRFRETFTGNANDALAGQVVGAIKAAHGKVLRIIIEEV